MGVVSYAKQQIGGTDVDDGVCCFSCLVVAMLIANSGVFHCFRQLRPFSVSRSAILAYDLGCATRYPSAFYSKSAWTMAGIGIEGARLRWMRVVIGRGQICESRHLYHTVWRDAGSKYKSATAVNGPGRGPQDCRDQYDCSQKGRRFIEGLASVLC